LCFPKSRKLKPEAAALSVLLLLPVSPGSFAAKQPAHSSDAACTRGQLVLVGLVSPAAAGDGGQIHACHGSTA